MSLPRPTSAGRVARDVRRIGTRLAIGMEGELWLMFHLMRGGRLHWHEPGREPRGRGHPAGFAFSRGTLTITESGTTKRASLHLIHGQQEVAAFDRGGLEILAVDVQAFRKALKARNHTLKRALTDPGIFSGIGSAYSVEILHRARLSPLALTQRLTDAESARLFRAVQGTLHEWIVLLRAQTGESLPVNITATRSGMAVHGRLGLPCPDCGSPVQRIRCGRPRQTTAPAVRPAAGSSPTARCPGS